jgi:hypothetical protein
MCGIPAAMLENCNPPVTATGLLRSVVVPSPCVRDGQTGVERESQFGNLLIQQHLAGTNTHSTSWPLKFRTPAHGLSSGGHQGTCVVTSGSDAGELQPPSHSHGAAAVRGGAVALRERWTNRGGERESVWKFVDSTHTLQEQTHTQLAGQSHSNPSTWPLQWRPPGHTCGNFRQRCWRTATPQSQPRGCCGPWWCRRPA